MHIDMEKSAFLKTPNLPSEPDIQEDPDVISVSGEIDAIPEAPPSVQFRWRLVASHPDPRHGTLDDDRKSSRAHSGRRSASCYSTGSGSCSRHTSARHSRCRSTRGRLARSAPGGGALPLLDTLEREELELRQEAERADDSDVLVEENDDLISVDWEEGDDDDDDDDVSSSEDDDVTVRRATPEPELSSRVYRRACSQLGIVPASFFSRRLQSTDVVMKRHLLGPKGAKACAIALVLNTSVQHLDLSENDIGDVGAGHISQMLSENLYITSLSLAENGITSEGLRALCGVLLRNTTVRKLDLSGNHFCERDASYIGELLKENTTVHEFYLRHNDFREVGGELIAGALVKNSSLVVLDLSWNHLRRKGAVAISESLEKNDSLQVLRLAWNGWYLEGCKALGKALAENRTLVELDLTCNRINKDCVVALFNNLKRNTTLERLSIDSNPLTADGARAIMSALKEAPTMAINFIDISNQSVDQMFVAAKDELSESRPLTVLHGVVFQHDDIAQVDDSLLDEDPMMVLMEFMRQRNMRLVDLFQSLDTDGSKSLTRDEFREGLLGVNIPMSAASFDKLMKKLDQDGDGEVDFSELLDGQKEYKRKLMRIQKKQSEEPDEESEIQRIQRKISMILAAKAKAEADKKKAGMERMKSVAGAVMAVQGVGGKLKMAAQALTAAGGGGGGVSPTPMTPVTPVTSRRPSEGSSDLVGRPRRESTVSGENG